MKKSDSAVREALADMFDLLSYKVRNGVMTTDDVRAIMSVIEGGNHIKATVKDLAGFYHQSEDNVRHIIHRNFMPSPERKVFFDFNAFRQFVPDKWHHRHSLPAD